MLEKCYLYFVTRFNQLNQDQNGMPKEHQMYKMECVAYDIGSLSFFFQIYFYSRKLSFKPNKQEIMTRRCHNHRPRTNPGHLEEEKQNTNSYTIAITQFK